MIFAHSANASAPKMSGSSCRIAVNRFTREFMAEFCTPDGAIDWEKLVQFNSSAKKKKRKR